MTSIIIEPKDKDEFDFLQNLLKKMKIKGKTLSNDDMEDYAIAKKIENGMKSKTVSKELIIDILKK